MSDERIICVKCGRPFIWSYGEQRFYAEHELHQPKHCPDCRPVRRAEFDDPDRPVHLRRAGQPQSQPGFSTTAVLFMLVALLIVVAVVILWWLLT